MSRATLDKEPHEVASMFDGVSRRYDLTNALLSLGQDRRWRRHTRRTVDPHRGQLVLDLAAGTGVSTSEIATSGAYTVACDFSIGMLQAGRKRSERSWLPFVAGDATRLPFRDEVFDAVTISFGLRNVVDVPRALAELARVTKPGGLLVVCEFSRPVWRPFRTLYLNYLMRALPRVARAVSSNPDAYVYLAESIRVWPAQEELARTIAANGWSAVSWRNLTGGIVALHRGIRPTNSDS
jgi:demethylmenaquinone methyltransferase/2-methoxy-6-polyprenyl-1,4-benzoquinol methylase